MLGFQPRGVWVRFPLPAPIIMGYFRRHKLTDYTADECRKELKKIELHIFEDAEHLIDREILERWACFRELLARHEKNNQSPLDK